MVSVSTKIDVLLGKMWQLFTLRNRRADLVVYYQWGNLRTVLEYNLLKGQFAHCISFLLLLKQITTILVSQNNNSILSYSSKVQTSEIALCG